jgi:cytochrome c biogenesis protein CcdA
VNVRDRSRIGLALSPGVVSLAMWWLGLYGARSHSEIVASISLGLSYAVWWMPIATPLYLWQIAAGSGRGREGSSVLSFVLLYSAVCLTLWLFGFWWMLERFEYPA